MSILRYKRFALADGGVARGGDGGGGSSAPAPQPTNTTVQNTNIPAYAQPYVETMLGTAQQQIFNYDNSGNVTGMKPYVPYSSNPTDYVAGFSPLQQQAQSNVANMQTPSQYGTATDYATTAGLGALSTANPAAQYGGMGANYGGAAASLAPAAQQFGANAADIGALGGMGYGAQGSMAGQAAANIGTMGGMRYGQQGAQAGQTAANIGTAGGLGYGAAGMGAGQQGAQYGALGTEQGLSYGQNAQDANAVQSYMNPYLQATLAPALALQNQQFGIQNMQNQAQATQQGAFGGGRSAVMQGLNQQNQALAQNQLVGNAYNQAYNTANQNMQQAAQLGMQGAGVGIQGQQAAMQGAGLGLQGVNAALAGQQAKIQGANTGLAGVNAGIQGQQAAMQGAGVGLQGVNAAMQGQQAGLQGLSTANQLYGQGIAGANTGLQGTAAEQAAYQQLGTQGTNLANIAGQQTQSALGINQAQQAAGAAQQAQQQNIINQQIQNYATAQQYPMLQLSNMSNLLRGLPMQSSTTQTYQAAPSAVAQLGGLGATALGAYGAAGGFKSAKAGGLMKSYAAGGQVAFDVGGSVESDLYNMDDAHLMQEAKTSPSAEIRKDAVKILTERRMEAQAMGQGVGAAPAAQSMQMAGGGIVAFAGKDESLVKDTGYFDPDSGEYVNEAPVDRKGFFASLAEKIPGYGKGLTADPLANNPEAKAALLKAENAPAPTATSTAPAPTGVKPDALGRYVAGSEGAPVPPAARSGLGATAPAQSNVPSGYEAEIQKRLGAMDQGLGGGKAQADLDALRKEIGGSKNDALWQALMMGGLKTMGSRSPWAGVAIGEGGAEGVKSYAEAAKGQREDQKLLIAQQSALEQAEYARKTGNLNALIAAQARLDQIKAHRETIGAQYAGINASKEATLEAAKQKTFGELYMKAFAANGGDDAAATITAQKAMQMGTPANSPISAPKAGDIIQGWKFKGGNPKEKSNWEKA
jgi:hypothetical protein